MNMHFCTAKVNLSGQGFHIFEFLETDPISWPEAQVLMQLHGEENVYEVKPVSVADTSLIDEKRRLLGKYGKVVEQVFPGRVPRMEMCMPGETEDQRRVDADGLKLQMPDDEDEDGDEVLGRDPPTTVPVMKPGRHQRPVPPILPPVET